MNKIIENLMAAGFDEKPALAKAELLGVCLHALKGVTPACVLFVPGRIEVLGKHTDYAGGRSLTCAIDRGIVVAVAPRADAHCHVHACDLRQSVGFELSPELRPPESGWSNYVMSVARRLARNFPGHLNGADIAFASDLPHAGGMSSSSALIIATYLALDVANNFAARPEYAANIRNIEDLAGYLGTCENGQTFGSLEGDRGVGTFGGSEDHTAILCSKPGQLSMYSYKPVRLERRVDLPADLCFVIGVSGVVAEKTAAARDLYNRLSRLHTAIMDVLKAEGWDKPTLAAAIDDDEEAVRCITEILSHSRHPQFKPAELVTRFEQFAVEHQKLLPGFGSALDHHDYTQLGMVCDRSQFLAETHLQNQVPETVSLVKLARQSGAVAASAFGAGFGGSVWALAKRDMVDEFVTNWQSQYRSAFPSRQSQFFRVSPVGGATKIS